VAELLIEDGVARESLHYLGTERGVERQLVPGFGINATFLPVEGLGRRVSLRSLLRNVRVLITMARARGRATQLLRRLKPRVVVSVGGYGSVAGCAAAKRLGIPVVTCSYDRRPGLATRRQARYAAASAVAHLPSDLARATLTGAPVRAVIRHLDQASSRSAARERLGLSAEGTCVAVMGGSLGSQLLNRAVDHLLAILEPSVSIVHLSGDRYLESLGGALVLHRDGGSGMYVRRGSTDAIEDVYAAADVIVARAGASTVAEVATVGVASVLVPWKDAAEDHQTDNARWLTDDNASLLVAEDEQAVESIGDAVSRLVEDVELRASIAQRARSLGDIHRHAGHAALIRSVAR
jgi:UDP-N-acetylglucosamine--N-acetylmuramyl-(pentapeptide) pyrophosphoryl-undecaprenol N-acetylglucosamine transferase